MRLLNRSAGRLSRHRRGPFAGLLLLLLGLVMTGALYAAFSPASSARDEQPDAAKVAQGRQLFLVGCAFCHGQNGQGQLTYDKEQALGPSLVGVGASSVHFQVETGRMPATQPGAQIAAKKTVYTQDEIDALAAYVASLAPGPEVPSAEFYTDEGMTPEEKEAAIVRGGQIFLTNCTACHNFTGAGGAMPEGKYAPSLLKTDPIHIYEAMQTGPGQMDIFSNGNLSPEEKRDVVLYIESARQSPDYGGWNLGSLGPVTEGLAAWLIGIGVLVGFAVWIAAHTARSTKEKVNS